MFSELDTPYREKEFIESLTETITWCLKNGSIDDPKHSLRVCLDDYPYLLSPLSQVHHVIRERRSHLRKNELRNQKLVTGLCGGRLLIYCPDWTDSSGAAEAETGGFLDVHSAPPLDTWVWYVQEKVPVEKRYSEYLVAWVPPAFLKSVERGIQADPIQCIAWLDKLTTSFAESLRKLKLIF